MSMRWAAGWRRGRASCACRRRSGRRTRRRPRPAPRGPAACQPVGAPLQRRVGRDRQVRLGDADRQVAEAVALVGRRAGVPPAACSPPRRRRRPSWRSSRSSRLSDVVVGVEEAEVASARRAASATASASSVAPRAAVGEVRADRDPRAHRRPRSRGSPPCSDGWSAGNALIATTGEHPVQPDVLDLLAQVGAADVDLVGVLGEQLLRQRPAGDDLVLAGVRLERPHRGDDHGGVGREARRRGT